MIDVIGLLDEDGIGRDEGILKGIGRKEEYSFVESDVAVVEVGAVCVGRLVLADFEKALVEPMILRFPSAGISNRLYS